MTNLDEEFGQEVWVRIAPVVRYQTWPAVDGGMLGLLFDHEGWEVTRVAIPHHAVRELIRQLEIADKTLQERRDKPRH